MIFLPVFVLFTADDMYNGTQDAICRRYPNFTAACAPDPDRYKTKSLVSTAFYRHINYYLGRSDPGNPAYIELIKSRITTDGVPDPRIPKVEKRLSSFNRNFIIALNISLALAGASLAILVQKILQASKRKLQKPSPEKYKKTPEIIQPSAIKTPVAKTKSTRTTVMPKQPIRKKLARSTKSRSTKKSATKKSPETLRPRTTKK